MRLARLQEALRGFGLEYVYTEVDVCGSVDFVHREIAYHIWEFHDDGWGAETNVRSGGRFEDVYGDYEAEIIRIIRDWDW